MSRLVDFLVVQVSWISRFSLLYVLSVNLPVNGFKVRNMANEYSVVLSAINSRSCDIFTAVVDGQCC